MIIYGFALRIDHFRTISSVIEWKHSLLLCGLANIFWPTTNSAIRRMDKWRCVIVCNSEESFSVPGFAFSAVWEIAVSRVVLRAYGGIDEKVKWQSWWSMIIENDRGI